MDVGLGDIFKLFFKLTLLVLAVAALGTCFMFGWAVFVVSWIAGVTTWKGVGYVALGIAGFLAWSWLCGLGTGE